MPTFAQWVVGVAAVVTAMGVIWRTVIRPAARLIGAIDEILPILRELAEAFRDSPGAFKVLARMADDFTADGGMTFRQAMDRLEGAADFLKTGTETVERLLVLTDQLVAQTPPDLPRPSTRRQRPR